jgi:hypothetical protein
MLSVTCGACQAIGLHAPEASYAAAIASGLSPRLSSDDAVRITLDYLNAQTRQIAAPELHIPPRVDSAVAVEAVNAPSIDGCIPAETSAQIVWVTKGSGDYLNLSAHPWSSPANGNSDPISLECGGPGPAGTVVIDDATGSILGVYPGQPGFARPSPYGH